MNTAQRKAYSGDRVTVVGRYWRGHGEEWEGEVRGWMYPDASVYWVQCGEAAHKVHQVTARQVVSIYSRSAEGVE